MSLLLALDVGNTNVVMGLFDPSQGPRSPLLASWRMATSRERTSDEYGLTSLGMLAQRGIGAQDIGQVVISSVVPPLNPVLERWLRVYFHAEPFWIGHHITTGLKILLDNPEELGADRIVNAVAGIELFGVPLIAVDFGTATTFDVVSARVRVPGRDHQPRHRHQLPRPCSSGPRACPGWRSPNPARLVGKNTVQAMQSGLYFGYVGLVDGILARLLETHPGSQVIATGGLARVISPGSRYIQHVARDLTLEGLRILWQMNRK